MSDEKKLTDEEWFEKYKKNCRSIEQLYCEQLAQGGSSDECIEREIECDMRLISYIHRLQSEVALLNSMDNGNTTEKEELNKTIAEQKAEIERLTELQSRGAYRVAELGIEKAELQKQVDELKDTAKEIYSKVKRESGAELLFLNDLALWIKERFGVSVEKWI